MHKTFKLYLNFNTPKRVLQNKTTQKKNQRYETNNSFINQSRFYSVILCKLFIRC